MPELPEVQTVVAHLDATIRGAAISKVEVLRPEVVLHGPPDLGARLEGRVVERVGRHGKQILVRFGADLELRVHLGMTGNLSVAPRDAPVLPHTHVRLALAGRPDEVRFRDPRRFGGLWVAGGRADGGRFSARLGPDALDADLEVFAGVLARRRAVKALLLDQTAIAGLGNIYVDEALHRAGIHPLRRASTLRRERVARLHAAVAEVLREAIAAGGSSLRDYRGADGEPGWFQVAHRVYGREGDPCLACGATIRRLVVATRGTHVCPRCQPAPRTPRRRR